MAFVDGANSGQVIMWSCYANLVGIVNLMLISMLSAIVGAPGIELLIKRFDSNLLVVRSQTSCIIHYLRLVIEASQYIASARAWNSLPPSVRNASSLMSFRRNLKTVLFRSSFND